jgi:CRP/FNR family transcriptional regulator, anaerobic regulatory protein
MNSELLFLNIKRLVNLSDKDFSVLLGSLKLVKIKRKQLLIHEGQVAKEVAFVLKGCLRSYTIDQNGFEHILQFAPKDWWITDMYSFISQKEAFLTVDAINDSEVLLLKRENQLKLFEEIPSLERYFRILTENALVNSRKRLMENLSLTAAERYNNFCKTYPSLINEIPQKLVASYIGVTPEFLSKLKRIQLKS